MDNGLKKIKDMFSGRVIFRIPEYQRAYAWEEKQLLDFYEDFKNQKSDRKFFFGTILLQAVGESGSNDVFDIVDGQQRITTLVICMNVALGILKKNKRILQDTYIKYNNVIKLQVSNDDLNFFVTYILGKEKVLTDYIKTPSQNRLLKAKEFFEQKLAKMGNAELLRFIDKIENANVLTYVVSSKSEATLMFETTNDRGKELSNLEKIKSFLMYNTYLASQDNPEMLLSQIERRFSEIFKESYAVENEISDNSILLYHYIAFGEWENKEYSTYLKLIKQKLTSYINNNKLDAARNYVEDFSNKLLETFTIVTKMYARQNGYFYDIKMFSHLATFFPLLIKAYKYDSTAEKRDYERVCRYCSIFNYRVFNILDSRADKGQQSLYRLARDFNGKDYDSLIAEIKKCIEYFGPEGKFLDCLKTKDFYNKYDSTERNFFFWKYENMLREIQPKAAPITRETFASTDTKTKFSIEHILPQTPTPETCKVIEMALTHDAITADFEETYLHSIGNLTIDPFSANSSKGRSDIAEKDSKYFKRAPFKSQNELEDFLTQDKKWTHISIEQRQKKLIDFAMVEWCFRDIREFEKKYQVTTKTNPTSDIEAVTITQKEE